MKQFNFVVETLAFALLFTFLFYEKSLGINLLIFELLLVGYLFVIKKIKIDSKKDLIPTIFLITNSILTVYNHSALSITINILFFISFIGYLSFKSSKAYFLNTINGLSNIISSQINALIRLLKLQIPKSIFPAKVRNFSIYLTPIIIIVVFAILYNNSNPIINSFNSSLFESLISSFNNFIKSLNFKLIFFFIFAFMVSNFIFSAEKSKILKRINGSILNQKIRMNQKLDLNCLSKGLLNELKSGVFLLLMLNILLLIFNIIDIKLVWFEFEWQGETLRSFVHEGTYNLIYSVIISISVILYFFRKNQLFLKENNLLKFLAYIFIFQNIILTISLVVRNIYYVEYFSLAYLRTALFIFLLLLLIALISVFIYIKYKQSFSKLIENNFLSFVVILLACSFIDFDKFIAIYNRNNIGKSYYDLYYHSNMTNKTLEYIDLSDNELDRLFEFQSKLSKFKDINMSSENYKYKINKKKFEFKKDWQRKSWLEWNYAEYKVYKYLME